jgi:hypothetical protein
MRPILIAAALVAGAALPAAAQNTRDSLPDAAMVPEGTIQLSGVVPAMGEHWGNPADMPLGPIYCIHEGKIVCLEFMIAQADFEAGKSWPDLAGMDGLPPVDHVSIGFEPAGHEGYEVPHYDIHMYFLPPEEIAKIQP